MAVRVGFVLLVLCVWAPARAQRGPVAPTPLRFAVRVDGRAGVTPAIEQAELVRAFALRIQGPSVDVVAANEALPSDWLVVVSDEPGRVSAYVDAPTGERIAVGTVPSAQRASSDLAHTIVLLVLEALEPIFPDLGGVAPPIVLRPEPPVVRPPPSAPPPVLEVAAGAWGGASVLGTPRNVVPGVGVMVQAVRGRLVLQADGALWPGPGRDGTDYSVHLTQTNARLAGGVGGTIGPVRLSAVAGPVMRLYWVHGDSIATPGAHADLAFAAQLSARLPVGPIDVVFVVDGLGAVRAPRFVIDDQQILSLGRWAFSSGLGLLYRFGG
jgi:hypothetical protein